MLKHITTESSDNILLQYINSELVYETDTLPTDKERCNKSWEYKSRQTRYLFTLGEEN